MMWLWLWCAVCLYPEPSCVLLGTIHVFSAICVCFDLGQQVIAIIFPSSLMKQPM